MSEEKNIVSKKDLWRLQAPAFNFELDEDQLLKKALSAGFVTQVSEDQYEINNDYQSRREI
tara:strand:- start:254 stop:436 length:183 start_codon:yes stop_codon:yes gene_type:complete